MIDYFAHTAAARSGRDGIATTSFAVPAVATAAAAATSAAAAQPGAFALGALVDHLVTHAEVTDEELAILQNASALFGRGRTLVADVASIRAEMEYVVANPGASDALPRFLAARSALGAAQQDLTTLKNDFTTFQGTLAPAESPDWLAPHGQQLDQPVSSWAWRDIMASRRTTALLTALVSAASGAGAQEQAFALGAVTSHAGNATGSGFLNDVVGGPRRAHGLRHRLAAYALGGWLRDNAPAQAGTLAQLRAAITFGPPGSPALPSNLATLLSDALGAVYPATKTPPLPDLSHGYANLLRHMALLDSFGLPDLPAPIALGLMQQAVAQGVISPQAGTVPAPANPPQPQNGSKDKPSSSDICLDILTIIVFALAIVICVIAIIATGDPTVCFPKSDTTRPDPGTSETQLQAWSGTPEALKAIAGLYNIHAALYDALLACLTALRLRGLIYPDPDDYTDPTFSQFIQTAQPDTYPHRPVPVGTTPLAWPATPTEDPVTSPAPWPAGADPTTFLSGTPAAAQAATLATTLWAAACGDPASPLFGTNLDLDADRAFLGTCWTLMPATSINDEPVHLKTLAYSDV
jgi:hypothetical protein